MILLDKIKALQSLINTEMRQIFDKKDIDVNRVGMIDQEGKDLMDILVRCVDEEINDDVDSLSIKLTVLTYRTNDPYLMLLQLNSIDDKLSNIAQYLEDEKD